MTSKNKDEFIPMNIQFLPVRPLRQKPDGFPDGQPRRLDTPLRHSIAKINQI